MHHHPNRLLAFNVAGEVHEMSLKSEITPWLNHQKHLSEKWNPLHQPNRPVRMDRLIPSSHTSSCWWETERRSGRNPPQLTALVCPSHVRHGALLIGSRSAVTAAWMFVHLQLPKRRHNEPKSRSNKSITNYKRLKAFRTLYFHSKRRRYLQQHWHSHHSSSPLMTADRQ